MPIVEKKNILKEADELTSGDRQEAYGHPRENFQRIADLWGSYKKVGFTSKDVAMMMLLVKVARESVNPKRDNLVDIAGYARTAEMLDE